MMEDLETDLEELEEKLKFYADQILSEEDEEPQKLERLPFSSARSIDLFSLIIIYIMNYYLYSETCLNRTLNKPKSCINLSKPNPE